MGPVGDVGKRVWMERGNVAISASPKMQGRVLENRQRCKVQRGEQLRQNSHISSANYWCYWLFLISSFTQYPLVTADTDGRPERGLQRQSSLPGSSVGSVCKFPEMRTAFPPTGIAQMATIKGNKRRTFPVCPGVL